MKNQQYNTMEVSDELLSKIKRLVQAHGDLLERNPQGFDKVGDFFRKQTAENIKAAGHEPKWYVWPKYPASELLYDGFFDDLEEFMLSEGFIQPS